MEKILNDELMVILFQVQPPKQRVPADYVISRPLAAGCNPASCHNNCNISCKNGCKTSCTAGCKGSCKNGCTRSCKGSSR